ncbi:DUF3465 domain-containing protein [Teredinibacter purpureus]|uniref:DUF3465 domain-containing protein n=1 Tax=Teredinibacter purpureus TaxID=2731756 RepID=UPI0005F885F8|nr:DUF3465 domain-containing protein [Teredinibacter purpureus]
MKSILRVLLVLMLFIVAYCWGNDTTIAALYDNQQSDVQVFGRGVVVKVLPDDTKGSRHQKFILRLDSGHTLLIAHNIDLAPRLKALKETDVVEFYGEYEWNSKGGVIHWTHRDPNNKHVGGWLRYNTRKYE